MILYISRKVFKKFEFKRLKKFKNLSNLICKYSTLSEKRSNWEGVVGLEVHAQINTESKLFSGSSTLFGGSINDNVAFFDAAIPGTLPVLNKECVKLGVLTAVALSCRVNEVSMFDRKHYFYADLPAGYQITQQRYPLANDGLVTFLVYCPAKRRKPYMKTSKIKQLQLEQDSGKSLHDEESQISLIDLNRAGIPLMEIVFEPDISDGEEAAALINELVRILTKINTCSCKMEEGALRVDANISVHKKGNPLGVRTEVKNIGSVRGVANAVDFEIKRQIDVLESGGEIINETRSWDSITSQTLPMRDKEVKQDYRFMPEPNLPPLNISNKNYIDFDIEEMKAKLPELPEVTRKKLKEIYNLPIELIVHFVNEDYLLQLFLKIMSENPQRKSKTVGNILSMELTTLINKGLFTPGERKFNSKNLGEIVDLLQNNDINLNTAKHVMQDIANGNPLSPKQIIEQSGMKQISDLKELHIICMDAINKNPNFVAQYKSGKTKVLKAILGYIARETKNKANMKIVVNMLKELLDK